MERPTREGRSRYAFGVHTVEEHLGYAAGQILEIWLAEPLSRARRDLATRAASLGVAVRRVALPEIDRACPGASHQGAIAVLREFRYAEIAELTRARPRLLVAADGVEDPRNLGALIRAVAAAGAGGLIIPKDRASAVTPATEKAAAGVTAFFQVARVTNLARTLGELSKAYGYWVAALAQDGAQNLYRSELPEPLVLVVGGEAGIRPLVRQNCDTAVAIPMSAGVESLNLAVAAAVACFELRRRLG